MAKNKFTAEDDDLLDALGIEDEAQAASALTPSQERVLAGFEEIQTFVDRTGRSPLHREDGDIFERLYAIRLHRMRQDGDMRGFLEPFDSQRLLSGAGELSPVAALDDDALLAALGAGDASDLAELRHVRPASERRLADEVATRQPCEDFDRFRPTFIQVQKELEAGLRDARPFELKAEIEQGSLFIVGGQKAYVADKGDTFTTDQGRTDARLRVIFDNGTESRMLMRSLQRALNKDEAGRRITNPIAGPLFGPTAAEGDEDSGTIYVLRSKSDHPLVAANRELVHKIGVTNLDVSKRIAGARLQPTFLMADVEVIATYELFNISRTKLEQLIHRVFEAAQLDIRIEDRFGRAVVPREWFLVPLFVIDEAVAKIRDGSIGGCRYDPTTATLR
ncbi:GIY-YIG nuclease family protein [Paracoccus sphaerophysae]|uniref:GIY-YIG nuclease family protein n=1 Tax=Paracoccus sphaerophysae TaxID=690417 RepID=UPI002352EBAE|nr:GIY-YIG nuclease family protein [Paracoccus sphaerophysae]